MKFICGCRSKIDEILPLDDQIFKTFDAVVLDDDGFMVCFVHRERRYGWRSVPYTALTTPQGADPGWNPLEYERFLYWGVITRPKLPVLKASVEDRRDNRDPISLVKSTSEGIKAIR